MSTPMVRRAGMSSLYEVPDAKRHRMNPLPPSNAQERPYKLYRAGPKGLRSRLRGEDELAVPGGPPPDGDGRVAGPGRGRRGWATGRAVLKRPGIADGARVR